MTAVTTVTIMTMTVTCLKIQVESEPFLTRWIIQVAVEKEKNWIERRTIHAILQNEKYK